MIIKCWQMKRDEKSATRRRLVRWNTLNLTNSGNSSWSYLVFHGQVCWKLKAVDHKRQCGKRTSIKVYDMITGVEFRAKSINSKRSSPNCDTVIATKSSFPNSGQDIFKIEHHSIVASQLLVSDKAYLESGFLRCPEGKQYVRNN